MAGTRTTPSALNSNAAVFYLNKKTKPQTCWNKKVIRPSGLPSRRTW